MDKQAYSIQAPNPADCSGALCATYRCTCHRRDADQDQCACCPTEMDGGRKIRPLQNSGRNAGSRRGTVESSASGSCNNPLGCKCHAPPTGVPCKVADP